MSERPLRPNTICEYRRILKGPDTQGWGPRRSPRSQSRMWSSCSAVIEARGSPAAANRSLAYFSKFFKWCLEQELIAASPTARGLRPEPSRTPRPGAPQERSCSSSGTPSHAVEGVFGCFFAVLLLTGQRRAEVAEMTWAEVKELETEQAIWVIPKERTMSAGAHLVPLAPTVRRILRENASNRTAGVHHHRNDSNLPRGCRRRRGSLQAGRVQRADHHLEFPHRIERCVRRRVAHVGCEVSERVVTQ